MVVLQVPLNLVGHRSEAACSANEHAILWQVTEQALEVFHGRGSVRGSQAGPSSLCLSVNPRMPMNTDALSALVRVMFKVPQGVQCLRKGLQMDLRPSRIARVRRDGG